MPSRKTKSNSLNRAKKITKSRKTKSYSPPKRSNSSKSKKNSSNNTLSSNSQFEFTSSSGNNYNVKHMIPVKQKKPKPKPNSKRVISGEKIYRISNSELLNANEVLAIDNIKDRISFTRAPNVPKTNHVWLVEIDGFKTEGFPHISCHNNVGYDSPVIHMRFGNVTTEKKVWKTFPYTGDWGKKLKVREFITKEGKITGKEPELSLARIIKDKWNQTIAPTYLPGNKYKKFFKRERKYTLQPEDMYLKG